MQTFIIEYHKYSYERFFTCYVISHKNLNRDNSFTSQFSGNEYTQYTVPLRHGLNLFLYHYIVLIKAKFMQLGLYLYISLFNYSLQ